MDDFTCSVLGESVFKPLFSSAWSKVCGFFKDSSAENDVDYRYAYEEYINNTIQKYSKVKTLIYRHTPKYLYSFYESCNLIYNDCEKHKVIDTSNINNVIKDSSKIIITGTGGIGKTTMLRHFFLNSIKETNFIPVFVELRNFNDMEDISLYQLIYQNLKENGFDLEEKYFQYSLTKGAYIFLLDGFDEINGSKKYKVQRCIKSFSDTYRDNKFIITSRPMDELISLSDFVELQSMRLTKEQALRLVSKIEFDEYIKEKFYVELERALYDKYTSFASNPLLLTIMLLTFEAHASIPTNLKDFYEQAFLTLFNMHDATKLAYVRDIKSKLGYDDFKTIFSYICFKSFFNSDYQFSYESLREYIKIANEKFKNIKFNINDYFEDLMLSVCMIIRDGNEYVFTHRTFQEYFAAVYTCKLTDDNQKKLLKFYCQTNSISRRNNEYMKILVNMQNEKFIGLILIPELKKIKRLYDEMGFSYDLLSQIYDGIYAVGIFNRRKNRKEYFLCLSPKNLYLNNIIEISRWVSKNIYISEKYNQDLIIKLIKYRHANMTKEEILNKFNYVAFGFDLIEEAGLNNEMLEEFRWFEKDLLNIFNLIEEYGVEISSHKKTLKSFVDTL